MWYFGTRSARAQLNLNQPHFKCSATPMLVATVRDRAALEQTSELTVENAGSGCLQLIDRQSTTAYVSLPNWCVIMDKLNLGSSGSISTWRRGCQGPSQQKGGCSRCCRPWPPPNHLPLSQTQTMTVFAPSFTLNELTRYSQKK